MTDRWRVGRRVGYTIYRQRGPEASDGDEFVGSAITPELADELVNAANQGASAELDEVARLAPCAGGGLPPRQWFAGSRTATCPECLAVHVVLQGRLVDHERMVESDD